MEARVEEKPVASNVASGQLGITKTEFISASRVWDWHNEARDASTEFRNRSEKAHNYYDHEQWTEEERLELRERGQPDTTINRIKPAIDLILGTESKVRVDYKAAPRHSSG